MKYDTKVESLSKQGQGPGKVQTRTRKMNSQGARAIVREVLFLLFCIQLGVAHNNDLVLQCSSPIKLFPCLKPRGAHCCLLREIGNDLAHGHRHGMRLAHERGGITEWKFP
ncbi:unnamed protein product [Miscanthus lutarioriparius]|uniref:Uncharacterized protein n=1 Tax=Miscanthus lutarioriparius TaxID=422564 RepID=A0A811RZ10_9POAL|nr:unnamed protein product [Miscanthus lutarioriparius]